MLSCHSATSVFGLSSVLQRQVTVSRGSSTMCWGAWLVQPWLVRSSGEQMELLSSLWS